MDLELLGDLRGGLDVLEGLNGNPGLELGIVSSSFTFHYQWFWFGGFTAPVHHYLSLAPGPNSGVHLTCDSILKRPYFTEPKLYNM